MSLRRDAAVCIYAIELEPAGTGVRTSCATGRSSCAISVLSPLGDENRPGGGIAGGWVVLRRQFATPHAHRGGVPWDSNMS